MAIHIKPTIQYLNDLRKVNPHLTGLVKERCVECALHKKKLDVYIDGYMYISLAKIANKRGYKGFYSLTPPKMIFYKIKNYFEMRACHRATREYNLKDEKMWVAVRKALHPNNKLENVGRVIEGLVDQEKKAHKKNLSTNRRKRIKQKQADLWEKSILSPKNSSDNFFCKLCRRIF